MEDDSGVVPWRPTLETQLKEIEQKRLVYGQFSTAELKRRCPEAFEPGYMPLFIELIEARNSVAFWEHAHSQATGDCEFRTQLRYVILAFERAAESIERKLKKALKRLGFEGDEIDYKMMELAKQDFDEMPRSLRSYIATNSPVLKRLAAESVTQ
jgi:hypothetical protein